MRSYANCLADEHGLTVSAPFSGAVFDLVSDEYITMPEGVPVARLSPKQRRSLTVFENLLAAVERLMRIARACRGIPNKELAKFTGQINSLADKWAHWEAPPEKRGKKEKGAKDKKPVKNG